MPASKPFIEKEYNNYPVHYFAQVAAWHTWLLKNADKVPKIRMVIFNRSSGIPSVSYAEALEEALCFGWIDSKINKRDSQSHYQFWTPHNPKSNWSRVNKQKIEKLMTEGRMQPAGLRMVALARETGTRDALKEVEEGIIPPGLQQALQGYPDAAAFFEAFPRSVRRAILERLLNAKTADTQQKRIAQIAAMAQQNKRFGFTG